MPLLPGPLWPHARGFCVAKSYTALICADLSGHALKHAFHLFVDLLFHQGEKQFARDQIRVTFGDLSRHEGESLLGARGVHPTAWQRVGSGGDLL